MKRSEVLWIFLFTLMASVGAVHAQSGATKGMEMKDMPTKKGEAKAAQEHKGSATVNLSTRGKARSAWHMAPSKA